MTDRNSPLHAPHARSQEGSAFIITLMVLLILTVVGLSVTLITQTEFLIGSQERTVQRNFYTADSGISVQTALALNFAHYNPIGYRVRDVLEYDYSGGSDPVNRRVWEEVEVTPLVPVLVSACDGCEVNNDEYIRMVTYVRSTAERWARDAATTTADGEVPLARKSLLANVDAQPLESKVHAQAASELTSRALAYGQYEDDNTGGRIDP